MSKLFQSMKVGDSQLQHRMVMAPLTRFRADDDNVPLDMVKEYYAQRACVPGTQLISEGTQISSRHAGLRNAPGIWSRAQIDAWRKITDAVHEKGSYLWCQLWAPGRANDPDFLASRGHKFLSSSAVPLKEGDTAPQEMTEQEIQEAIEDFVTAASNAIEAGFDGVEIHGANGYLLDQFLQDTCNQRTDRWGGSIENRARLHVEVTKAVAAKIGSHKVGMRLSPWSDFQGMLMENPEPTFTYVVEQLRPLNLAFLDLIEARISGNTDAGCGEGKDVGFLVEAWGKQTPVMLSGGFTPESARQAVDETYKDYNVAIIFGRYWTSNPDLPFRVEKGVEMVKYDRSTFYTPKKEEGYIDWDFSEEFKAAARAA